MSTNDHDFQLASPHTLSMAIFDSVKGREVLSPLIPKGTPLPTEKRLTFTYSQSSQLAIRLHLYEGDGIEINPTRVELIAEVLVAPPPDTPAGSLIDLQFELDRDCILHVKAVNTVSAESVPCSVIHQKRSDVPPEKLMQKRAYLESQLKILNAQISSSFRVFISAKSADYEYANQIYKSLAAKGVAAFLSPVSLPALASSDYRKEIDRALDQAQNMVLVASSVENVISPWVEAEWGLFINEKRSGRKSGNLVTVVVGQLQPADLPASLRYYEVIQFGDGVVDTVLRYIRE